MSHREKQKKKHLKIVAGTDLTPRINTFFLKSQDLRPIWAETTVCPVTLMVLQKFQQWQVRNG